MGPSPSSPRCPAGPSHASGLLLVLGLVSEGLDSSLPRRDLPPYVPLSEAWKQSSHIISAFLNQHLSDSPDPRAADVLRQAYDSTGALCRGFLNELEPATEEVRPGTTQAFQYWSCAR
jgi:hypothetical protein